MPYERKLYVSSRDAFLRDTNTSSLNDCNKSQLQSFQHVQIYLQEPGFCQI